MLIFFEKRFMDGITELSNGRISLDNDRGFVIWNLSLWLGVDSNQVKIFPCLFH
jgi:hypothetical protein